MSPSKTTIAGVILWVAIALAAFILGITDAHAHSAGAEAWRTTATAACAAYGCDPEFLLAILDCESGGDPYAVSNVPNPYTGSYTLGVMQIDPLWGDIAYAGGAAQIWWAAALLSQPGGWYHWTCAGGVS